MIHSPPLQNANISPLKPPSFPSPRSGPVPQLLLAAAREHLIESCPEVGAHRQVDEEVHGRVDVVEGEDDVRTESEHVVVAPQVGEVWLGELAGVVGEPGQQRHDVDNNHNDQHLDHLPVSTGQAVPSGSITGSCGGGCSHGRGGLCLGGGRSSSGPESRHLVELVHDDGRAGDDHDEAEDRVDDADQVEVGDHRRPVPPVEGIKLEHRHRGVEVRAVHPADVVDEEDHSERGYHQD